MIRVLVVDDSAVVRRVLSDELARHAGLAVVGTAADPYAAREQIARLRPDVVTLDVEMPRMDGLSFLARLRRHLPVPVVVVTSHGAEGETAAAALALGAAAVVGKPGADHAPNAAAAVRALGADLARAVRAAHAAQGPSPAGSPGAGVGDAAVDGAPDALGTSPAACRASARAVLAVGASTGGTQAIERVLRALPADAPGAVIVQHMPAAFTAAFARRLDGLCAVRVREARDGDPVEPGVALVAPGGRHLVLRPAGGPGYVARVRDGPPVHHQRPAVDVLFQSVARHAGREAVGVLLTGMGADGARGLLAMREAGAHTVAQDEATSVVFGMPREAARLGAAAEVAALDDVGAAVLRAFAARAGSGP